MTPKGKNKAASIWSVDSGYASNTLEEDEGSHVHTPEPKYPQWTDLLESISLTQEPPSSFQQNSYSSFGDFFKVQVEGQLRLQRPDSPTAPVTTRLNVFTTKVDSRSDVEQAAGADEECVLCRLWDITNPGENLKCERCTNKSTVTFGAVGQSEAVEYFQAEQASMSVETQMEILDTQQQQGLFHCNGKGQCSACNISVLISQGQNANCNSCSSDLGMSSPESLSNASQVKRSSAQRPPTKLELHALRCLKTWLRDNSSNPYPDADTKRTLAEECGITEKQVATWFTNARARRRISGYAESSSSGLEGKAHPASRLAKLRATPILNGQWTFETSDHVSDEHQKMPKASRRGKKKDYSHLTTICPATTGVSALPSIPAWTNSPRNDSTTSIWQCTFCYQNVSPKSWRRHEETQHRPKRKWTCLHTGPRLTTSCSTFPVSCAFCMVQNPGEEHFQNSHRITECMAKSEEERTFLRPDHLRQHVKNYHQASLADVVRDMWRRDGVGKDGAESWTCGFCGLEITAWDTRQSHIAAHFKAGLTMADWKTYPPHVKTTQSSRKRPTSSEGRPNVFSKLARTFTSLTTRQDDLDGSQSGLAYASGHATEYAQIGSTPEMPFLPELIFDSFTTGMCGDDVHFSGASVTDLSEEEAVPKDAQEPCSTETEDAWLNLDDLTGLEWNEECLGFLDF
ncbi:uncharacterized protein yc1106_05965 [Curvularia clavata]|uniref:Homeobox domain-containing protein n=1 Tax=Curvularia clavata TaxID=95742 RepID=A0A9Q8ZAI9_CURCL|nr:uncharacterized protein yc1106_05965 [Curvularia clavata]